MRRMVYQGSTHFFGTDGLGRDIWTRVWEGTRISLMIAFIAVIVGVLIGIVYGLISGYFGGKVDIVMQRFTEILNSIPQLVITTLLIVVLKPGLMNIVIVLFLTGWIRYEPYCSSTGTQVQNARVHPCSTLPLASVPKTLFLRKYFPIPCLRLS